MKNITNFLPILVLFTITACNKTLKTVAPLMEVPQPNCRIISITDVKNMNPPTTIAYEYDAKNRLVKTTYSNRVITYSYNANDFLLDRTIRYNANSSQTDKFLYTNEKLATIEHIRVTGQTIENAKTTYEYDAAGNLTKMIDVDYENNETKSTYNNNILKEQTSNLYTYEINSSGQLTKVTNKITSAFTTAGSFTRYFYDKNGQAIKQENVDVNGVVVAKFETEFTEFKNSEYGFYNYLNGKGFPKIGKILPKFHIKKETTFLYDSKAKVLYEFFSYANENYVFDKKGVLMSSTLLYKGNNVANYFTVNSTYKYEGCE